MVVESSNSKVNGYYSRTQFAMNRFPVLNESCYGSLMGTLRFASAAPPSIDGLLPFRRCWGFPG
ncbi:hypothetical protein ASPBRDRAFT_44322 [Aspergillus brasiliensis CBS 101740]|uniref:Uncharacterized protein n=1 Tax=Aspergillus brasiliensis (strain CBS 101740 / IMI 381727 / IBT 21946) TaxID=767769 RepID=A0A1L9UI99_ASPBC|nr:hypothetical protein ASPBRDRAFT_44322 [Aspergillus brasiliensis CBS 101740]